MKKIYKFYVLSASDEPELVRYVGVTQRESVKQRFYGHKYCALHPEKRGLPVHKWMWSKYEKGLDIIVKEIDSCEEEDWEDKEKYWISVYKEGGKLLNISEGGKGIIPKNSRSLSSIERSAKAHEKPITLLDKEGKLIEQCPSINYAVEKYKMSRTAIGNVLSGRAKTSKEFYILETSKYNSNDFNLQEFLQKINDSISRRKNIYRYDLQGNLIEVLSSKQEFHNKYGYDSGAILRAINNKTIYKDSYWSINVNIDVNEFEPEYKYVWNGKNFKTLRAIAQELELAECTITNAKNKNKPIKGYYIEKYKR